MERNSKHGEKLQECPEREREGGGAGSLSVSTVHYRGTA